MKTSDKKGKELMYNIHACFEIQKENNGVGKFCHCPFSTCSCTDGALFCSHLAAVIGVISLAQYMMGKKSQDEFVQLFNEDPRRSQDRAVLIENYTISGYKKRRLAHIKRNKQNRAKKRAKLLLSSNAVCTPCGKSKFRVVSP